MFNRLFGNGNAGEPRREVPRSSEGLTFRFEDQLVAAPEFLKRNANLFRAPTRVLFTSKDGRPVEVPLKTLDPTNPDQVRAALTMLHEAASWERARRGYPVRDATNDLIFVPLDPHLGFVIETTDNADGSQDAVVAFDIEGCLDRSDYDQARKHGLGGITSDFKGLGDYTRLRELDSSYPRFDRFPDALDGYQPIGRAKLRRVQLRKPDQTRNPFAPPSTVHGSAQYAWITELQAAGLTTMDKTALPLGNFIVGSMGINTRVAWPGEGHTLTVGPPGSGKFTSIIAPLLLTADETSIVVFDVKNGEAAKLTSLHRFMVGKLTILDPFGITGRPSGAFNPLDTLRADDPYLLEKARRLAEALYIPTAKGGDAYWDNQARSLLTAALIHVATWPLEEDRTLRRVRQIIRRRFPGEDVDAMRANEAAGGWVADKAMFFGAADDAGAGTQSFAVIDTLESNTEFLDLPSIQNVTATTTISIPELRAAPSTLYVVCPSSEVRNANRWLRLIYTVLVEELRSAPGRTTLHVVMDEFPQLGRFERVVDDMAVLRDLDVHLHLIVQSLEQLRRLYGEGLGGFFGLAEVKILLGCDDPFTAQRFSTIMGKTTRLTQGTSHSRSMGGGQHGESQSLVGRDLLAPDELMRMPALRVYVVAKGLNTLRLQKTPYLIMPELRARAGLDDLADDEMGTLVDRLLGGKNVEDIGGGEYLPD